MWRKIASLLKIDCGTDDGLTLETVIEGGEMIESLSERIVGRFPADDIVDALSGDIDCQTQPNDHEPEAEAIETAGLDQLRFGLRLHAEATWCVCNMLRSRFGPWHVGELRRSGWRYCRSVDW